MTFSRQKDKKCHERLSRGYLRRKAYKRRRAERRQALCERYCRPPLCIETGKQIFEDDAEAQRVANLRRLYVYRCDSCGFSHLSRSQPKECFQLESDYRVSRILERLFGS